MNIFYLDYDQSVCAQAHVDKHCVKMVLEYAQLLSTAHRVLDGVQLIRQSKSGRQQKFWKLDDARDSILYSATHINHPSAIWARQSVKTYSWLSEMLTCLCKEYTHRYGRVHKVESSGLMRLLNAKVPLNISKDPFTEPTPAMPDIYKVPGDSLQSYKNYYLGEKTRMFSWKHRTPPVWVAK